ncbi:hypothetical protein BG003_001852, partial [Podila horticola]
MSAPVSSFSIFDITLIVDSICGHLSMSDVQTCRRVSKQWASMFRPHLWCTLKISSATALTDKKLDTIFKNKKYVRSLTTDELHLEQISRLNFTDLRELVLLDEHYGDGYFDRVPVSIDTVVALVDNNPDLQSLEICLPEYNYHSGVLSASLMLAIERHPSLRKLSWRIPYDHASGDFFKCLLSVCQRAIQELNVDAMYYSEPYCSQCGYHCTEWYPPSDGNPFFADGFVREGCFGYDFDEDGLDNEGNNCPVKPGPVHPAYTELASLTKPLEELYPFALRRVRLLRSHEELDSGFLHNCPFLQD